MNRIGTFPTVAVVIGRDSVAVAGTRRVDVSPIGRSASWDAVLPWVASRTATSSGTLNGRAGTTAEAVVVVQPGAGFLTDGPAPLVAGWTVTGGEESGWWKCQRMGVTLWVFSPSKVALARNDFDPDQRLWQHDAPEQPELVARRLGQYHGAIGAAYRYSPGAAGTAALRTLVARTSRAPVRWRWDDAPEAPWHSSDVRWSRPLVGYEREGGWVQQFDVRAMYLAAAGVATLGVSPPTVQAPRLLSEPMAGAWLIDEPHGIPVMPPLIDSSRVANGRVWVTEPVLRRLNEMGHTARVHEVTATDDTREGLLRPWSERVRDALVLGRSDGDEVLRDAYKATYTETVGLMRRPGGLIFRPDWRAIIIDTAKANMLRKVAHIAAKHGAAPFSAFVDSLWYAGTRDELDTIGEALGAGDTRIGKFKREGDPVTVEDYERQEADGCDSE